LHLSAPFLFKKISLRTLDACTVQFGVVRYAIRLLSLYLVPICSHMFPFGSLWFHMAPLRPLSILRRLWLSISFDINVCIANCRVFAVANVSVYMYTLCAHKWAWQIFFQNNSSGLLISRAQSMGGSFVYSRLTYTLQNRWSLSGADCVGPNISKEPTSNTLTDHYLKFVSLLR